MALTVVNTREQVVSGLPVRLVRVSWDHIAGLTLIWMTSGIRRIVAARAWKKRHSHPKDLTNR
jgi:hypothetical protein